ncbi:MAG TPA: PIG-L deacetylase family protein [Acidimicrobiales bacterium]|nr:PIG-L deacetylase family protein [Acidimicrobiales bacterium]
MSDTAGRALELLPDDWDRALCIAAHPDDLEYGVASAVARWTSRGKEVTYLLATRGEAGIDSMPPHETGPRREAEERAGAAEVGVDVVEFLGLRDGMIEAGLPLRRELARHIRRRRPEVLVSLNFRLSWGGRSFNMADHRVVGEAVLDAARDAGNRWIFPELVDEGFDPWNGVRMVCFGGSPAPSHAVDVTGHLDTGIASLRAHAAYLANLGDDTFDPDDFLRRGAESVGLAIGVTHAVSFEVFEL